jgi:hypothetical protein
MSTWSGTKAGQDHFRGAGQSLNAQIGKGIVNGPNSPFKLH